MHPHFLAVRQDHLACYDGTRYFGMSGRASFPHEADKLMKSLRAKEKAVQVRSERVTCSVHVFSAVLTYLPQLYDQIRPPLPREPAVLTSCHSRISEGNFTTDSSVGAALTPCLQQGWAVEIARQSPLSPRHPTLLRDSRICVFEA